MLACPNSGGTPVSRETHGPGTSSWTHQSAREAARRGQDVGPISGEDASFCCWCVSVAAVLRIEVSSGRFADVTLLYINAVNKLLGWRLAVRTERFMSA